MLAIRIDRLLSYIYWVYAPGILSNTCFHTSFMTIPEVFSTSLLCLAVWVVWKVIKKLIFVPDLDNIPGPPSDSYLKGKHYLDLCHVNAVDLSQATFTASSGPMLRIFTKKCLKNVRDEYTYCPFAYFFSLRRTDCKYQVSFWGTYYNRSLRSTVVLKRNQESKILLSDPKALHHIIIKVSSSALYSVAVLKYF